jgi:hypothetical protein
MTHTTPGGGGAHLGSVEARDAMLFLGSLKKISGNHLHQGRIYQVGFDRLKPTLYFEQETIKKICLNYS